MTTNVALKWPKSHIRRHGTHIVPIVSICNISWPSFDSKVPEQKVGVKDKVFRSVESNDKPKGVTVLISSARMQPHFCIIFKTYLSGLLQSDTNSSGVTRPERRQQRQSCR